MEASEAANLTAAASVAADGTDAAAVVESEPPPKSLLGRFNRFLAKNKQKAASLGVNAVFAYGFVSNVNVAFTVSLAWYTFGRSSGLSPLAGGQWSRFLLTYAGIYATLGTVLRPFRIALAASIAPAYGRAISWLQARLPFREKRPKLNRALAITVLSIVGNMLGSGALAALGIWVASLAAGVPVFPPDRVVFPWLRR